MKIINSYGNFQLKNDGELEIFFIGTGTSFTEQTFNNNFIIVIGEHHILVDFEQNGPESLKKSVGINPSKIETLFISHSHSDHIGGVELLALTNRYLSIPEGGKKLELINLMNM